MPALTFNTIEALLATITDKQPIVNARLGDILVEAHVIRPDQLQSALQAQQKQPHLRIGTLIVALGLATERQVQTALMQKFGIPIIHLPHTERTPLADTRLSYDFIQKHKIVPLAIRHQRLLLAMADPLDWKTIALASEQTGLPIDPVMATSADINAALQQQTQPLPSTTLLPIHFMLTHQLFPLGIIHQRLYVATKDTQTGVSMRQYCQYPVELVHVSATQMEALLSPFQNDLAQHPAAEIEEHTSLTYEQDSTLAGSPIGINSVIKGRFLLVEVLGEGGMGTVYKAIDKRKQEAKDHQTYVAIKLLKQSFKDPTSAFITMAREASKTQTLTHPNIVIVNDFDRDGEHVYIVMEYLQGHSLNEYIATHYAQGMPTQKAFEILKSLASALSYAHAHNIVHCDFKPSNAFITKTQIKVIDFGISRFSSQDEYNHHDPILDGFTPAYATHEIIAGKNPVPSDDVYALACTAYKLMTGCHPYQGHSSIEAERLGLRPQRIKHLSRRQWQGLLRGLTFSRQTRTSSVQALLQDLLPKQHSATSILMFIGACCLSISLAVQFSTDQKHQRTEHLLQTLEQDTLSINELLATAQHLHASPATATHIRRYIRLKLIEQLKTSDNTAAQTLAQLHQFKQQGHTEMLTHANVQAALSQYVQKHVQHYVNPSQQRYHFSAAQRLLNTAAHTLSAARIAALQQPLTILKNTWATQLGYRYQSLLRAGHLSPSTGQTSAADILQTLAQHAPKHRIFTTHEGTTYFHQAIKRALKQKDKNLTRQLIDVLEKYWPDDTRLFQLKAAAAFTWADFNLKTH